LITIENVDVYSKKPIIITIPIKADLEKTLIAGYYDKASRVMTPITLLNRTDYQIQVAVTHFSSIIIVEVPDDYNASVTEADTGFRPGIDDWQFANAGSFLIPDGACGAQSLTMQWYYKNIKQRDQKQLFGRYDNLQYQTSAFWEDDSNPYRFVAAVQSAVSNQDTVIKGRADSAVFKSIKYFLYTYKQPVLISMKTGGQGHLCVAYKFKDDTIYIADPNFPGEERTLKFHKLIGETGHFEDYQSGFSACSEFLLIDSKYFFSDLEMQNFWSTLDNGVAGKNEFPDYVMQYRLEDGTFSDLKAVSNVVITTGTPFYVRGSVSTPDGRPLYFKLFSLQEGNKPILLKDFTDRVDYAIKDPGTYGLSIWTDMKGNGNIADYRWLDFKWFNVTVKIPKISVRFEDKALERVIRDRDMLNRPTGEIYNLDLLDIGRIEADGKGVRTLNDLKWFPNLQYLNVSSNQISDINGLSGLSKLTYLLFCDTQVLNINPLSGLINLEYLNIQRCGRLKSLGPITGLTNLKTLALDQTDISDISGLKNLVNLEILSINHSSVSDIGSLSNLNKLTMVRFVGNKIKSISSLSGLTNMEYLNVPLNQVTDISPLKKLAKLKELEVGMNQISDISVVSNFTQLTSLSIYYNQVEDISAISGLTKLTYLMIHNNHIRDISALRGLTNLEQLVVIDNPITDYSPLNSLKNLKNDPRNP
jgi:Leucine-rich repeat (LRR) protein